MDRIKWIWYLSPMRAAKVQASLRIRAVSPEPPLLTHTSSESSGTFRQKARSLAPLNGWACAVKICNDGMLEDTNSLDGAHVFSSLVSLPFHLLTVAAINIDKNKSELSFTESHDNCLHLIVDKSCSQVRAYKSWENRSFRVVVSLIFHISYQSAFPRQLEIALTVLFFTKPS